MRETYGQAFRRLYWKTFLWTGGILTALLFMSNLANGRLVLGTGVGALVTGAADAAFMFAVNGFLWGTLLTLIIATFSRRTLPMTAPTQPGPATAQTSAAATPTMLPPAGWLTDPYDASQVRYWDGQRWTSQTRPGQPVA